MPFEYHVTCKESDSKKKVAVESKAELIAAIQRRFDLQCDVVLQEPFDDDWLDVEDLTDLKESGKLRFLKKNYAASPTTGTSTPAEVESPVNPVSPTGPTGFGIYALPSLPQDIRQLLIDGSSTVATSRRDRARITQILYDDLRSRVGLYPSNQDVTTVCHTLVMTYPCLQDKIKIGQNAKRYSTWYESLRQKCKDIRRPLTCDEQVVLMKGKYGGRAQARRKGDPLQLLETPKSKTPRLDLLPGDDGEDDRSLEQHIAVIQQQWGKSTCDIAVVTDRMARTYGVRRALVKSGAKLVDILKKYPALKDRNQLQMEFFRMTRVNLMECVRQFWTGPRVEVAIRQLRLDRSVQDIVSEVGETNVLDDKLSIVMRVLPRLFGEKLLCWTQSSTVLSEEVSQKSGLTVFPTFIVGTEIGIYFERQLICECADIVQAAVMLVMLYYVFDVEYPKELAKTYNFLDSWVGRLDPKRQVNASVQRKLNVLMGV